MCKVRIGASEFKVTETFFSRFVELLLSLLPPLFCQPRNNSLMPKESFGDTGSFYTLELTQYVTACDENQKDFVAYFLNCQVYPSHIDVGCN